MAINRRQWLGTFVALSLAGAFTARAQRPAIETIGFLNGGSPTGSANLAKAFERGLTEAGYAPDRNIAIEYRWGDGHIDRLPALARALADRGVKVLAVGGSGAARQAAKNATATTP